MEQNEPLTEEKFKKVVQGMYEIVQENLVAHEFKDEVKQRALFILLTLIEHDLGIYNKYGQDQRPMK